MLSIILSEVERIMAKIKQATKKTGRERKEKIVAELTDKFDSASGLLFADYKGLTHKQLEELKKELRQFGSTLVIAKNSLIKLSLGKSKNYADYKDNEGLDLPTATLFIEGDMVEPLKKVQKAIKDFGLPKIKFAILEGNLTDEAGVLKIASLPNRETLVAQFVGMLNSPISGLVVTLNGTIQKFVMTLDAVAKTKPATPAPAEPATPESPATETAQLETPVDSEAITEPENKSEEPTEEAVPANPPAETPEAPVETDSPANASSVVNGERDENIQSAEAEDTKNEEESKGGEN